MISYTGPVRDHSGYGETSRHHVAALHAAGVDLTVKPLMYTLDASEFGEIGQLVESLVSSNTDYKIKILHTTPDQFGRYIENGKYHVGFCYWETDKLPSGFADGLNLVDEVWTGCQANVEAIRNAGVEKPIYVIPQPLETQRRWPDAFSIAGFDGYLFYSIFEWIERKNPQALLDAYWREFQGGENVGLLLKTYHKNFILRNKQVISDNIATMKRNLNLPAYPPLFLYRDLMNRNQIMRVHSTGDCFVSAHRGEGWGLPQSEALLAGKPVISTAYGGVHEYLDDKTAKLVDYEMKPVNGMETFSSWYTGDQNWAECSIDDIRKYLRWAYEHKRAASNMGKRGQKLAIETFNLERVGSLMSERLNEIGGRL